MIRFIPIGITNDQIPKLKEFEVNPTRMKIMLGHYIKTNREYRRL